MAEAQGHTLPLFAPKREPLLMIMDGHAMVHRSFRAISTQRSLTVASTGEDITGVYGFTNVFLRALNDWNPAYCAIAFDTSAPTFRHERFEAYKAQREASPPELRAQFGRVKQLMELFGVPIFELDGWEADDIIGTLTRQAEEAGIDSVVLTGDRDTFQLISPRVKVDLASNIQDRKVYDVAELAERYSGLTPAQQPDFKALLGDSSDNIPGVPKVGEKTAARLLNEYADLEGIYEHLDQIKQKAVKAALEEHRERAFENRTLMTIDRHSPVNLDPERCRFWQYDRRAVVNWMTALEFFSVIPRVPSPDGTDAAMPAPDREPGPATDYAVVQTPAQLDSMIAAIEETGRFTFDTETTAIDAMRAELVGLSFATAPGRAWYVPVGHREGEQLPLEAALSALRPLFESPDIAKCAHNANYDMTVLANYGIKFANVDFDTMIAAHLLGRNYNQLGLKDLSLDVLGHEMTPITDLIGKGRKQITIDQVDIPAVADYAAADADITIRLREAFEPQLQRDSLRGLMDDTEMALIPALVTMQRHGIKMDAGVLHEMSADLYRQMGQIESEIYSSVGHEMNLNSPPQLSDVLFKELGLPKTKRTKTGYYSTDANSLESLREMHPVVDRILEYRQVSKLKSTYVDALPEMINPHTGRVHTSYNQTGSVTGRISSSEPNLQNIPIRTELGRQVRRAFVAEHAPDWQLFSADYSQIELRVLAHMSQDTGLLEAFRRGEDIHSSTASLMFDVPINDVDSEMRRIAKVLNFGVIYGLSPHGISQQTGFSREQGAHFIDTYFAKYPGISGYLEEVKAKARTEQYVETLMGRRRHLADINSANFNVRGGAERMAINMPIQGTAADIMKIAMIRVQDRLDREEMRTKMLLQVHDELVFEVPGDELEALKELVFDEMPAAMDLDVTLKVDAKWAANWGDME